MQGLLLQSGLFLETSTVPWQGSTASVIRNTQFSIECSFIILSSFFENMRIGSRRIISFIEEPKIIERIIRHLELTFEAERPTPLKIVHQELLMAAEESGEYF